MQTHSPHLIRLLSLILFAGLTLSACNVPPFAGEPTPTLFLLPTAPPSVTPPPLPETPVAEAGATLPTAPTDSPPTAEGLPPTPTPIVEAVENPPDCENNAAFIEDVTIPDGTALRVNEPFVKTWRIQNSGTCTWGAGYGMVYFSGEAYGNTGAVQAPLAPPGGVADISVSLLAPAAPELYLGFWRMQTPEGVLFGEEAYVSILVFDDFVEEPTRTQRPGDPTPTPAPTATPTPVLTAVPTVTARPTNTSVPTGTTAAITGACTYDSTFVADVTIPDDTPLQPGQVVTKTWRLRNTGTCTWASGTQFALISGTQTSLVKAVTVRAARPGETADISVEMIAPQESGTYASIWRLHAPNGAPFGSRPYVRFVVLGNTPTPAVRNNPNPGSTAIHNITARAREIYLDGQRKGNFNNVFAKVGDSITTQHYFLVQVGNGSEVLGTSYAYLSPVIEHFRSTQTLLGGNSFDRGSFAAQGGWDSKAIFDVSRADTACAGKTPLACEYEGIRPSVALIMIGTNDANVHASNGTYEANLRRIVDTSISYGVIPVLSTIPWNPHREPVSQFNSIVVRVARDYGIPWMDYYDLMEQAPNRGLSSDQVHPSWPPNDNAADFTGSSLNYGYAVRNLLALQTLDALWRGVMY